METIIEWMTISIRVFAIVSTHSFVAEPCDPSVGPPFQLQSPQRCERALVQQELRSDGQATA